MNIEQLEAEVQEMRMTNAETRGYLRRLRAAMYLFPAAIALLDEACNYDFPDTDLGERIAEFLDDIAETASGDSPQEA